MKLNLTRLGLLLLLTLGLGSCQTQSAPSFKVQALNTAKGLEIKLTNATASDVLIPDDCPRPFEVSLEVPVSTRRFKPLDQGLCLLALLPPLRLRRGTSLSAYLPPAPDLQGKKGRIAFRFVPFTPQQARDHPTQADGRVLITLPDTSYKSASVPFTF